MSDEAVITLIGTVGMILFFVVAFGLPQDMLDRWGKAKVEVARAKAEETNAELKKSMIERGFSADEIAQVMNAGSEAAKDAGTKSLA